MPTGRLEAFSDGVIAILITIMVLELHVPTGSHFSDLRPLLTTLLIYALSFVYLGIYWNNHHHMLQVTERITGRVLWANLHLLFWLSLFPLSTAWMGRTDVATVPTAMYGVVCLLAAVAYYVLQLTIIAGQGDESTLARAIGRDLKGKASPVIYVAGVALTFVNRWLAVAAYVVVALMWLVPDRRLESVVVAEAANHEARSG